MQNNSSARSPHCLSFIAGFALIITALGFAFFPNIVEAVPDMYVANNVNNTISCANLDGTGGVNLGNLAGTLDDLYGIALDVSGGKMYVANYAGNTISCANLDGTGGVSLAVATLSGPSGIALDVSGGKMYVANYTGSTISCANMDGTGGVNLGNLAGTLSGPIGIALDVPGNRMYVANDTGNTITRSALDGTGGVSLGNLNGTLSGPYGIALDLRQPLPPLPPATIPTLSEWGMIILSLLMAGLAILIIRRKKLVTPNSVR